MILLYFVKYNARFKHPKGNQSRNRENKNMKLGEIQCGIAAKEMERRKEKKKQEENWNFFLFLKRPQLRLPLLICINEKIVLNLAH